jgi:hypothetical protein
MFKPPIIEPIAQKGYADCWAACLHMLLGVPYQTIIKAAPRGATVDGLSDKQIQNLAKKLGFTLRWEYRNQEPEDDACGILSVSEAGGGHVVIYLEGIVIDPSFGRIYTDVSVFLEARKARITGFLWRES